MLRKPSTQKDPGGSSNWLISVTSAVMFHFDFRDRIKTCKNLLLYPKPKDMKQTILLVTRGNTMLYRFVGSKY